MKKAVLFVDDDSHLIDGLKRSMRGVINEWDLFFAGSAQEALDILEIKDIDVLVTDLRMPGMDGSQLLEIVNEHFPEVIRFVLSGQSDQQAALVASRVAHQILAKPCDTTVLQQTIRHSLQQRDFLSNPKLVKIINGINKLPSLPILYTRLMKEMESPDASSKSLGEIIAQDISMTAKVMQLVNSAFYSLPGKITDPQRAVVFLGINILKGLVLYQGVFSEFKHDQESRFSIDALWNHSLKVGALARQIARDVHASTHVIDNANVSGMMHDIGKLIQLNIPNFYDDLFNRMNEGMSSLEAEYSILGTTHAELGAYLLGIWGLPDSVVQAVAYHHNPSMQIEFNFSPLTAVHIANGFFSPKPTNNKKNIEFDIQPEYLETMNLTSMYPSWLELFNKFNQSG